MHTTQHQQPIMRRPQRCTGMTLVEVTIAMAVTTLMSAGIFSVALKTRAFAEHNRAATEARTLARERMEEMIAVGLEGLASPSCTLTQTTTNRTSLGTMIVRTPHVVWHAQDDAITNAEDAVYAEIHVDVAYHSPLQKTEVTDVYASLLH